MKGFVCEDCQNALCVGKVSIFAQLESEDLHKIHSLMKRKNVARGAVIFLAGEGSETLYIINTGDVKLSRYASDGREQILHILGEGDILGEMALLRSHRHTASAEALTKLELCTIDKRDFDKYLLSNPRIALSILEVVGDRLQSLENLVESLGSPDIERRLARVLVDWYEQYGQITADGTLIEVPLNREAMANLIGVTRETISRKLGKLHQDGVIQLLSPRQLLVMDKQALIAYL